MPGVTDPTSEPSLTTETTSQPPRALVELAASLRHTGASPSVEQALDEAWRAMHATEAAVAGAAGPARRIVPVWTWPVLAAAAAVVVALRLGIPTAPSLPDPQSPDRVVAAVPAGPFEPPPTAAPVDDPATVRAAGLEAPAVPPAPTVRAVASGAPTGLRPGPLPVAGPAAETAANDVEPFVWIRGADEIEPGLGLRIVRVQLPRMRWDAGTPRPELVNADVLMGSDGQARAVRVAWTDAR